MSAKKINNFFSLNIFEPHSIRGCYFSLNYKQDYHCHYSNEMIENGCGSFFTKISISKEGSHRIKEFIKSNGEENKELFFMYIYIIIQNRQRVFGY